MGIEQTEWQRQLEGKMRLLKEQTRNTQAILESAFPGILTVSHYHPLKN